ncbi:DUF3105 domain-containing protein [Amycolatopsis sp. 195334CR]|uniref:DUF3105 domain-containing protein n=1 Tax=Amycolatopsis sp. 195334CR TaxID=2814588 RepID=UPI001A8FA35B|nr:DUF3105 domain-containing protein [Amycolatopsis sp. 195334CR]MBN6034353.1 DUF3105 domain-containing protein [Amycolatopsis sp. 195334CR]
MRSTTTALVIALVSVLLAGGALTGVALLTAERAVAGQATVSERDRKLAAFMPSEDNPDPSGAIPGIVRRDYDPGLHVVAPQRVAYDHSPPFGGRHDQVWAACNGVVYPTAVRTEHLVHSLEHGSVWIAYNPDQVAGDELAKLAERVAGKPYLVMSPYPGLDQPISLQSWGHQLKVPTADDERIDQFITALLLNPSTYPEPGAPCDSMAFDQDAPPPFDPTPPGADAQPPI